MMKWKNTIALLLVACILLLPSQVFGAGAASKAGRAEFAQSNITVNADAKTFSLDIRVASDTAFSSAEFGLRLGSGVTLKQVQFSPSVAGSSVGPLEKNGVQYFGFFDTSNRYSGQLTVGTLTFGYEGSSETSVTLAEAFLTAVDGKGGAAKLALSADAKATVTRAGTPGSPPPSGTPTPTPTPTPGNGGGTPTPAASPTPTPASEHTTVRFDALAALQALESAQPGTGGIKTVTLDATGRAGSATDLTVEFPATLLQSSQGKVAIRVRTPLGTVELPPGAIAAAQADSAKTVAILLKQPAAAELSQAARTAAGGRPAIAFDLQLDGSRIAWQSKTAPISVLLPYAPAAGERQNPGRLIVYEVDASGQPRVVPSGRYDAASGQIRFRANETGTFIVGYAEKTFADTGKSWAQPVIEALAIRGIINGVGADKFAPNAALTRADFVKLLVGVAEPASAGKQAGGYSDVKSTDYYYAAVNAAQALGIIDGKGGTAFAPKKAITRQDMFVYLDRMMAAVGKQIADQAPLSGFKDAAKIPASARDSVARLYAAGIVGGSGGLLRPQDTLTRAEAAKVLYALYQLL